MNKKLAIYFSQYNMQIIKNQAYGTVKGYETNVTLNNNSFSNAQNFPLNVHISFFGTDEQKSNIDYALKIASVKKFMHKFTDYGISLSFFDITFNKMLTKMSMVLDLVFKLLDDNGVKGDEYCPVCGNKFYEEKTKIFRVGNLSLKIDYDCVESLNELIEKENKEFKAAPNNYLKGFVGALLGGLVGAGIAIILYIIGFISAISAVVAVFLGAFLFAKFKGKEDKVMLVIVSVTSLVCMIASIFGIYLFVSLGAAVEAGVDLNMFEAFSKLMEDSEFSKAFVSDILMTLLFSVIGIVLEIITLYNKTKRAKQVKEFQTPIK